MSKRRVRTHANPLSYPKPITRNSWEGILGDELYVDMGCGQGDFLISSALTHTERKYVGIEVREPMCAKVNEKIASLGLKNAVCVSGNGSISLQKMFLEGEINELYINFPDPWFKERHKKRRVLNSSVVLDLNSVLSDNGKIYLLTDVEEVFEDFKSLLLEKFKEIPYEEKKEQTYWEKWHIKKGSELYSACFEK